MYGARPLKRHLQRVIETPLARRIIAGEVPDGATVQVAVEGEELVLRVEPGAAEAGPVAATEELAS